MNKTIKKINRNKKQRRRRIRVKIFGTANRPRFSVFRSNRSMYLQLIDDEHGVTVASVNSRDIKAKGEKAEIGAAAGKLLAEKAQAQGIKEAVFDRGGNKYHGRVKAAAEGARAAGLKI